jgi:hypothetical protein
MVAVINNRMYANRYAAVHTEVLLSSRYTALIQMLMGGFLM